MAERSFETLIVSASFKYSVIVTWGWYGNPSFQGNYSVIASWTATASSGTASLAKLVFEIGRKVLNPSRVMLNGCIRSAIDCMVSA